VRRKLMYYSLPLLGLILVISMSLVSCEDKPRIVVQWYRTFGEGTDVYGSSIQQTTDSGYIVCGRIQTYDAPYPRGGAYLIKTDANGIELWDKIFGGEQIIFGQSAQQTIDGGYVLCGTIKTKEAGTYCIWLIKTDDEGNELWDNIFAPSGTLGAWGYSVQQTVDGGYIVCGQSDGHMRLIKTDAEGNAIWDKIFVGQNLDQGNSVQQTADGGYIVCGWTRPLIGKAAIGKPNVWLIKADAAGNKLLDKKFGGYLYAEGASVKQTSDGGYIICGIGETDKQTSIFDSFLDKAFGTMRPLLIKTDAEGNTVWEKLFDRGSSYCTIQTGDDGYIMCGNTLFNNGWLIKTDANGNILWDKIFGKEIEGIVKFLSIQQTIDGGYIVSGSTYSAGSNHVLLVKIHPGD